MRKFIALGVYFACAVSFAAPCADLTVQIQKLRQSKGAVQGSVLVSVFAGESGFPDAPERALFKLKLTPADAAAFVLENLEAGEYAIAAAHDENDNGKVDKNFLGIPKEGFGFSNDAKVVFGPPSYEDAKIKVECGSQKTIINTRYF